jgi:hypothetical protein
MYHFLRTLDSERIWLFDFNDLRVWFDESEQAIHKGLARHIADGLIVRVTRGLYANAMPSSIPLHAGEALVPYLRPLEINYESFESSLSGYGIISQIPMRLTMATTGGSGEFSTPFGVIEFTHVSWSPADLYGRISWDDHRMLWAASPDLAYEDLRRARRNLHLVDLEELKEARRGYAQAI